MDTEEKTVGTSRRASCVNHSNPQQYPSRTKELSAFVPQLQMAEENLSDNKLYLNISIQLFWCVFPHTGYNQNVMDGVT